MENMSLSASPIEVLEKSYSWLGNLNIWLLILAGSIGVAIGIVALLSGRAGDKLQKAQKAEIRRKDDALQSALREKDLQIANVRAESSERIAKVEAESREKIAALHVQAESLKAEAEEAGKNIALAQAEAAKANERAEELRKQNLELEKQIEPRILPALFSVGNERITEGIDRFPDTPILIQSVPEYESKRFARSIAGALKEFGWKAQLVTKHETNISPFAIEDGVYMFTTGRPFDPEDTAEGRAWAAGAALSRYMEYFGFENTHWPIATHEGQLTAPLQMSYPAETVVVLVGAKRISRKLMDVMIERLRQEIADKKREGPQLPLPTK